MTDFISGLTASLIETLPLIPAAIGFYIALRSLKFPDLTVEGSFVFGSVISALIIQNNLPIILAIVFSIIVGMLCGILTAFWNIKLKIPPFTSGIITTFIMTFVNYSILKSVSYNKSQVTTLSLHNKGIFEVASKADLGNTSWGIYNLAQILLIVVIIIIVILIVYLILRSKIGLQIRAFGSDRRAGSIYKQKYYLTIYIGLAFSNALVAFSGCIVSQINSMTNINKGASLLIPLLAAVIFGEFFVVSLRQLGNKKNHNKVIKPLLSRPFSIAIAPTIGFIFYNLLYLVFSAIIVPIWKLESYNKFWVISIAMIIFLAFAKNRRTEFNKDDLI